MGPFDRFNDRAKRVLALAQDEAIRFNHNYIGPEHLLLGLVREGEGVAARVLDSLGAKLSEIRLGVEVAIGRGYSTTAPNEITLHPRSKKIIELAVDEARKLGHSHVGTEHLLLGLVREGVESHGAASKVLADLGVDLEKLRHQVIVSLGQAAAAQPGPSHPHSTEPLPPHLQEVAKELERIRAEKEAAMAAQQYERASELRQQERALQEKLALARADSFQGLDAQGKKRDWYCEDVLSGKTKVNTIWEDERVLAFHHPRPEAPIHAVAIPKKHVTSMVEPGMLDGELLSSMVRAVQEVSRRMNIAERGFQLRSNTGAPGVTPHVHWHVMGPGIPPSGPAWRAGPVMVSAHRPTQASAAGIFDRFDESAKRVLALAQDEAIRFRHNYIGTEHLLLGLVREGAGAGARTLETLGVELSKVRTALEFIVGRGDAETAPSDITLSPRTKKILELAIDEAQKLGAAQASSGHLLLGLVREGEGIASGILESLGVSLEKVRQQLLATMRKEGPPAS